MVIPAVKVTQRDGASHDAGVDALVRLIEARVDTAQVFAPGTDVRDLVRCSGGYVRDLFRLIRYAANRTDTLIGANEVAGARRDLGSDLDRLIARAMLPQLAEVDREKRVEPTPETATLLARNLVLTYWNGADWADLHPAVRETAIYQAYARGRPPEAG